MLLDLRIAVVVVWSVGSFAAVLCLGVLSSRQGILNSHRDTDLHLGSHLGTHRSQGSSAAAADADAADVTAAIVLGPVVESDVVRVVAHIAVSQAAARTVVVGWGYRLAEGDSAVVGVREGMWAEVGRIGHLEEAQSTAVGTADLVCVRLLFRSGGIVVSEG